MRWLASLAELSEIQRDVLDIPDWDMAAKELGSLEGVPAKLMNSENKIKQLRKERQEKEDAAQEAMMAEQQGKGMEAMGKGAQAMKETNGAAAAA
jgi:hypothetical protein